MVPRGSRMHLPASRLLSLPARRSAMRCAAIVLAVDMVSGAACGGGGGANEGLPPGPTTTDAGGSDGSYGQPSDSAASELLGRWWGTLPAPAPNVGPLAALDVVGDASGRVTSTLWFFE